MNHSADKPTSRPPRCVGGDVGFAVLLRLGATCSRRSQGVQLQSWPKGLLSSRHNAPCGLRQRHPPARFRAICSLPPTSRRTSSRGPSHAACGSLQPPKFAAEAVPPSPVLALDDLSLARPLCRRPTSHPSTSCQTLARDVRTPGRIPMARVGATGLHERNLPSGTEYRTSSAVHRASISRLSPSLHVRTVRVVCFLRQ